MGCTTKVEVTLDKGSVNKYLYYLAVALKDDNKVEVYNEPVSYKRSKGISIINSIADGIALLQGQTGEYIPRLLSRLSTVKSIQELTDILTEVTGRLVIIRKRVERGSEKKDNTIRGRITNSIKSIKTLSTLLSDGEAELILNIPKNKSNTTPKEEEDTSESNNSKDKETCVVKFTLKNHDSIISNSYMNRKVAREIAKRIVWSASYKIVSSYGGGDKK